MTSFLRITSFWFLAQKQHGTPVSAVTEHLENNVDQNKNVKSWQYVNSTPNFRILPTMQKLWQAFLRFWEYPRLALITTANAQISDVSNSHLIDCRSFCPIQKAILHAAVSNNRQTPWGGGPRIINLACLKALVSQENGKLIYSWLCIISII